VHDEVTGADWIWTDTNYVRLDAFAEPVHILEVRR
jgi:starch synthase (maltosyl-transferring)